MKNAFSFQKKIKINISRYPQNAVTSPSYILSKFYHDILKNIVCERESHIINSTDFVNKIKQYKIPENYKLVSFDVKSLFTNIPLKLVISLITKKWDEIKKTHST